MTDPENRGQSRLFSEVRQGEVGRLQKSTLTPVFFPRSSDLLWADGSTELRFDGLPEAFRAKGVLPVQVLARKGVREHSRLKRLAAWGPPPEKFSDSFWIVAPTVLA